MMDSGGCGVAALEEGESLGERPSAGAGASDEEAVAVGGLDVGAEGYMDDGFAGCADAVVGADENEEQAETGERSSAGGVERAPGREIGCDGGRWGPFEDIGLGPGSASAGNGAAERGALRGAVVVDADGRGGTGRSTSTVAACPAELQVHFGMDNS